MRYEIRDPLLGPNGVLRVSALACHDAEAFIVQTEAEQVPDGVEFLWAYGGVSGQRGRRDGDIGTEDVPISQWFQLRPEFADENAIQLSSGGFLLRAKPGFIAGVSPPTSRLTVADASNWNDPAALSREPVATTRPIVVGHRRLVNGEPIFLAVQRVPSGDAAAVPDADSASTSRVSLITAAEMPRRFEASERYFAALRGRFSGETPDPFLNAAVGALTIAADAGWDETQKAIMHGAIAWRTKLLGWRGPYSLDTLGWHDRARQHFTYWAAPQNTKPVPEQVPPADESANLARNEAGLHSNGDLSNSHYDMNLVFIDPLFRHLRWTCRGRKDSG